MKKHIFIKLLTQHSWDTLIVVMHCHPVLQVCIYTEKPYGLNIAFSNCLVVLSFISLLYELNVFNLPRETREYKDY